MTRRRAAVVTAVAAALVAIAAPDTARAAADPVTYQANDWPPVSVGSQPKGVAAVVPALVANSGDGTVSVVTLCQPKSCAPAPDAPRLAVGTEPTDVAQGTGADRSFVVTNAGSNSVSVIDSFGTTVRATIPVGVRPAGAVVVGSTVFVANNGDNTVTVIDLPTLAVVATIPVGVAPWGVTASDARVFVANNGAGTVSVIDVASRTVTATIPAGPAPAGLALLGTSLYVANNAVGTVTVVDATTGAVTSTLTVGSQPWGVAAADGAVFVANYGSGTVTAIDAATGGTTATIVTGGTPFGLSTGLGKLVVTDTSTNTLHAVPLVAATPAPTWSKNKKRRSVTGVVPAMQAVTYTMVARSGTRTRMGTCRVLPAGTVRCTVSRLPKGRTWRVSVTTQLPWQSVAGGAQNKRFRF